jgi:hypothetical protein
MNLSLQQEKEKNQEIEENLHHNENLHNSWVLWYHTGVNDWSINSYKQIYKISDIKTFWEVLNNIYTFTTRSFFLFRNGILPIYEDENHKNGGAFSYKVHKTNADKIWEKICCLIVGETINKIPFNVTGISISPKLHSVVIKIWVKQKDGIDLDILDDDIAKLSSIYKSHVEKEDYGKYPNDNKEISSTQKMFFHSKFKLNNNIPNSRTKNNNNNNNHDHLNYNKKYLTKSNYNSTVDSKDKTRNDKKLKNKNDKKFIAKNKIEKRTNINNNNNNNNNNINRNEKQIKKYNSKEQRKINSYNKDLKKTNLPKKNENRNLKKNYNKYPKKNNFMQMNRFNKFDNENKLDNETI